MDSRNQWRRRAIPLGGLLWTLACQPGAELDFVRPSLTTVEAVSAVQRTGQDALLLGFTLLGAPSWWGLAPDDRVRVGSRLLSLSDLKSDNFTVSIAGQATTIRALGRQVRKEPLRLAVVVDNGESAARWDPQGQRLVLVQRLVDAVKSMIDNRLLQSATISVVVLVGGQARVLAQQISDIAQLQQQLDASSLLREPGGRAPLWDGVVAAEPLARPNGVMVLYWSSSGDGQSSATSDQALALARQTPVLAVRGPGGDTLPRDLARAGSGVVLQAPTPDDVGQAASLLASLLRATWQLELAPPDLTTAATLSGRLTMGLASGEQWSRSFLLPLFRP